MNAEIQTTVEFFIQQADDAIGATLGDAWSDLDAETKAALVKADGDIRVAIATLTEAKERLEEVFLSGITPGPENAETLAGFKVGVKQSSTFDKAAFSAVHRPDLAPHLYKQEPDLTAIKREIAPADLEAFYKPSKPSVDFKAL